MRWPPSKGCKFSEAGGAPLKGVSGPRRPGKSVGGCHPLAAPGPVPVLGPSACGRGGSGAWNAALRPALPPASARASGPHLASIRKTTAGGQVGVSRGASSGEKPSGSTSSRDPPRPPKRVLPSLRPLPLLPPGPSLCPESLMGSAWNPGIACWKAAWFLPTPCPRSPPTLVSVDKWRSDLLGMQGLRAH